MNEPDQTINRRILLIDDNESIHKDFRSILEGDDVNAVNVDQEEVALFGTEPERSVNDSFQVDSAFQGQEGLQMVHQALERDEPYAMAFVDIRMPPGWDGVETIEKIWEVDPDLHIVICTAYSDYSWHETVRKLDKTEQLLILKKPFDGIEVYQIATAMTGKWALAREVRLRQGDLETRIDERTGQLVAANEALKVHDRLKSEFVINVSHELRTPLTIFKGILSNALASVFGEIDTRLREKLEIADESVSRLARIISDFLDISEIGAGKLKLRIAPFCIHSAIREVIEGVSSSASEKNIQINTSCPDGEVTIIADRYRIIQVLTIMVDNAIRFVPQGGRVELFLADLDDHVQFDVHDNGIGIPSDEIDNVFNCFVQVEKQTGPGSHGTGLGLPIARKLLQMHGGSIHVQSTVQEGTTFTVKLPKTCCQQEDITCDCGREIADRCREDLADDTRQDLPDAEQRSLLLSDRP